MSEIDRTIEGVENLYEKLTGHPPANGESIHEPIPPEADPTRYVEEQLDRLMSLLGELREIESVSPALALYETRDTYLALVELAGAPRSAVKVTVMPEGILVEAPTVAPRELVPADALLRHRDGAVGPRRRLVPIPQDGALDRVSARLVEGLLVLNVPRLTKPHRVEVK
jgi:HSP20 family molecular chaperone IbpA